MPAFKHENGPGLKILSDRIWYGPGYCGICGQTDHKSKNSPLLPTQVRWWDADDGWRVGVLCYGCGLEATERGPWANDYAVVVKQGLSQSEKIDVLSEVMDDEDATYTEGNDL
jgi:hypothetical protein